MSVIENIENLPEVKIYTDGACIGNPGPGGWAAICISASGLEKSFTGRSQDTTNNRMELSAVVGGLSALKRKCRVTLYSDSKYIVDAINKNWLFKWVRNYWTNTSGDVKNQDLWQQILNLITYHHVTFKWVKGHAGSKYNERCDMLAREESHIAWSARYGSNQNT